MKTHQILDDLDSRTLFSSEVIIEKSQVKLIVTVVPGECLLSALQIEGLLNIYKAFPISTKKKKKKKKKNYHTRTRTAN